MNINSKKIVLLLMILLIVEQVVAQPPPPPPGLDISGGVVYLVIAGIIFGIKKLKE